MSLVTVSLTFNKSCHFGRLASFNTHYGSYYISYSLTAYGAGIYLSLSLYNGTCKTAASGISATTAVITRKSI